MGSPRDGYSSRWFIRAQWFSTWSDRLADATIVLSDPDFPQKRFSKPPKRPYLKKAKKLPRVGIEPGPVKITKVQQKDDRGWVQTVDVASRPNHPG